MSIPSASEAALEPLPDDNAILERVQALLGRGLRRQLWLMFLDDERRQLPLLMPCDVPRRPRTGDSERFGAFVADLVDAVEAESVVVTFERRGSDQLGDADLAWLRMVRDGCTAVGVRLHGPLLASREGVRWIAADDLGVTRDLSPS